MVDGLMMADNGGQDDYLAKAIRVCMDKIVNLTFTH
jgi:hypothetical protein